MPYIESMIAKENGMTTFTKIAKTGQWGVRGVGLTPGLEVEVTKRSGDTTMVEIAEIVRDVNGVQTATICDAVRPRETRYRGRCEDAPCCGCCGGESYAYEPSEY